MRNPCIMSQWIRSDSTSTIYNPRDIIASEASTHSLRAEAAKLAWTNKAKFYLHSVLKEKLPCCIPPSPVNSFPMSSKMYISVETIALYVFMQEKKESSGYLSRGLITPPGNPCGVHMDSWTPWMFHGFHGILFGSGDTQIQFFQSMDCPQTIHIIPWFL